MNTKSTRKYVQYLNKFVNTINSQCSHCTLQYFIKVDKIGLFLCDHVHSEHYFSK